MKNVLVFVITILAALVFGMDEQPTSRRSEPGVSERATSGPTVVKMIIDLKSPEEQLETLAPSIPPEQFSWTLRLDESKAIEWLKSHRPEIKRRDANGLTALHWAARLGKLRLVEELIKQGASIDARSTGGDLPGETPLSFLMDDVQRPLDKHSTPDDVEFVNTSIRHGIMFSTTPLGPQYSQIVEKLISHGADVNSRNDSGRTPLMKAVYAGHAEIVDLLLRSGASVTITDDYDKSAMDVARGGNIQEGIRRRVKRAFQGLKDPTRNKPIEQRSPNFDGRPKYKDKR